MKIISIVTTLFLSISLASATDFALRILLNKGQSLPSGETCSSAEWSSILSTIDATISSRRRNLRNLRSYPPWCAQKCVGFASGSCIGRHPSCDGYRQLHGQEDDVAENEAPPTSSSYFPSLRNLFVSTTCQGQINELNTALNNLEASLSPQCRSVLNAQREFTCLTTITDCDIQEIRLMNADTDTVIDASFTSGESFRTTQRVTFEAINDSCVCNVQFNIKNAAGQIIHSRFEFYRPFVAFSNSAPNAQGVVDLFGARFGVGSYSLDYYPDNDPSKTKTITFTVTA